mmetsp:Transcript_73576/g.192068  ORF Transcript_73576/g.192068 Transcript_73576/m.192068 type:complete len:223 (-) Transcript_73576:65-733(-)
MSNSGRVTAEQGVERSYGHQAHLAPPVLCCLPDGQLDLLPEGCQVSGGPQREVPKRLQAPQPHEGHPVRRAQGCQGRHHRLQIVLHPRLVPADGADRQLDNLRREDGGVPLRGRGAGQVLQTGERTPAQLLGAVGARHLGAQRAQQGHGALQRRAARLRGDGALGGPALRAGHEHGQHGAGELLERHRRQGRRGVAEVWRGQHLDPQRHVLQRGGARIQRPR